MKKFFKYVKGYILPTILTPLFIVVEVLCEVYIPLFMSDLIDNGLELGDIDYVYKIGIRMIIMAILSLICGVLAGRFCAKAGTGFGYNMRKDIFNHVQKYSFYNIDKFSTGSIVTRLTTDSNNIQMAFTMGLRMLIRMPLMMIIAFIMAIKLSKSLSLIYLVAAPILCIVISLVMSKASPLFKIMMQKYDRLNTVVQEDLIGIRAVKSFVREDYEIRKFQEASRDVRDTSIRAERIIIWTSPIMMSVIYATTICIYWFGGKQIAFGEFTPGALMSFSTYTMYILMGMMMLSMVLPMSSMAIASGKRIIEAIDEVPDIQNPENPIYEIKDGSIDFNNMSYSYSKNTDKCCLTNIDLHIKSGETIGVFGPTGSGKSSLVSLLPRLYDATVGEVKVGGINVKEYDIKSLRDSVAVVLQKNVLFSGTIKENLLWGNKNATEEQIIQACKLACCYDFIMSFEKGFDTYLEQGGVNLSGGQKQRICIARALLKNPKILILDDSTSAVDTQTDSIIREGFKNYLPEVTKIIIAQRVSSVENADKILVLDEGKIESFGTHEELIKNSPIYKEIYEIQVEGGKA